MRVKIPYTHWEIQQKLGESEKNVQKELNNIFQSKALLFDFKTDIFSALSFSKS